MKNNFGKKYKNEIVLRWIQNKGVNVMQVPKLEKIVVNMGIGKALENKKILEQGIQIIRKITGQQPVVTKAKISISNFKLRIGNSIGCKVTLRRSKMYNFLEKLIQVSFPRIRDFKGLSPRSFDGKGNYSLGIREQIIFPEISYNEIDIIMGMDIAFVTSAENDVDAKQLLTEFGIPFREN